ncbi:MAG TPA: nucleotide sugar dehydrogenase, partial [Usitatibacter sp.]|nr:nucleotide sugar dehydrogenase [Usitatibacter sp.]
MKISVMGLGYVGAVAAGCLAAEGHEVIGVDSQQAKVDLINAGKTPIIEKDIGEIIAQQVAAGRLAATTDVRAAVLATDLSLVCVGTPSLGNGHIDLKFVRRVCEQIGEALKEHPGHTVVMRSTLLPGSMKGVVIPALEGASGLKAGEDFGLAVNPEFLREGTAVYDYFHPPKTVIGEVGHGAGEVLQKLYGHLPGPMIRTDYETAEMVKYADNTWHA